MKPPTSSFGCFFLECVACHGDKEWQEMAEAEYLAELDAEELAFLEMEASDNE